MIKTGRLFLIPTTLGNPITNHSLLPYQLPLIKHLRHFIVETAKTGRLHIKQLGLEGQLQNLSISELNKHTGVAADLIAPLLNGHDVGLLSDCGIPAIADPGSQIVYLAHQHQIPVIPLVGPSSLMLTLMASGVNGQSFAFAGYIPIEKSERLDKIRQLEQLIVKFGQSQIIIETPFRTQQLLEQLIATLANDIILALGINLMHTNEQVISMQIKDWKKHIKLPNIHKHEVVFVCGKPLIK